MRLYDRETDESAKAFEAWTVYRDLGAERSLLRNSPSGWPRCARSSPSPCPSIHTNIAFEGNRTSRRFCAS